MEKRELHARNRHQGRYDLRDLIAASPALAAFVVENEYGDESIDFADPAAVKSLNQALLRRFYGIREWDFPAGYLCPPIPGRADYLHEVADLLADASGGEIPRGPKVRVLDIGTGASLVYPLIGHHEYGWTFVGSEIDASALASARRNIENNPRFAEFVQLRAQASPRAIFAGIIQPGETFDLTICNPPFHASASEAAAGSRRKWKNLGRANGSDRDPVKNFGGVRSELWCEGGERAFISRMVKESATFGKQCGWFTTLVAKAADLPAILGQVERSGATHRAILEMGHGQKKSRVIAWTFRKSSGQASI